MRRIFSIVFVLLFIISVNLNAQLTPSDAAKGMMRGINIGNTMEPPVEGSWGNPPVTNHAFTDYKNAGFTAIRIPITWDLHMGKSSPYKIDEVWLTHVEKVIDDGLSKKLFIIINAHHDGWIKESYTPTNKARFDSLWSQVATRFKDKSDSLIFEIINEPNPISLANINDLNKRVLQIIRKTNPTRIVCFSGNMWSNSQELVQVAVPDTSDHYLIGYYHSYDPYPFGLEGPGTYGSDSDIATTAAKFKQVTDWGARKKMPVILGEYGYMKNCEYNSRMCAYATVVDKAFVSGVPPFAWDDNGDFPVYNRITGGFNEIKDILIYTYPESPNKMKISMVADTLVKLQWKNRTTKNDSIIVQRKVGNGTFENFKTVAPGAVEFIDSTTFQGKAFYYRLKTMINDSTEIQSYPIMKQIVPTHREPFLGSAVTIPGIVEAENYDKGGDGLTFHDTDELNQGGSSYRPGDGVDLGEHSTGKYHIGYVATGEWLEYSIDVPQTGTYGIEVTFAAGNGGGGQFTLKFGNGQTSTFNTVATSSWATYTTLSNSIRLVKGEQIIRLSIAKTPAFDIDKLEFSLITEKDEITSGEFRVYPNPATYRIEISAPDLIDRVTLYNSTGQKIFENNPQTDRYAYEISKLTKGMYFLNAECGGQLFSDKIVIN